AAFVAVDRLDALVTAGTPFEAALQAVRNTTVFEGSRMPASRRDRVPFAAVERHLAACWPSLAASRDQVLALGDEDSDRGAYFSTTTLGVNVSERADTGGGRDAIPQGVHVPTWIARELEILIE